MNEYPKEVNISFFKTNRWITGAGEEGITQVPPAICNAIFKATGKRHRSIPLKNQDLSTGASKKQFRGSEIQLRHMNLALHRALAPEVASHGLRI